MNDNHNVFYSNCLIDVAVSGVYSSTQQQCMWANFWQDNLLFQVGPMKKATVQYLLSDQIILGIQ